MGVIVPISVDNQKLDIENSEESGHVFEQKIVQAQESVEAYVFGGLISPAICKHMSKMRSEDQITHYVKHLRTQAPEAELIV